ncbi:hypothetical protein ACLOJK_029772 [Asimina triloba]
MQESPLGFIAHLARNPFGPKTHSTQPAVSCESSSCSRSHPSSDGRKLPGLWIVDGRDEDGSWPTTDRTAVKMLPSMMGFWGNHGCPSSSLRSALLIAGRHLLPGSAAMEEVGSPPSTGSHRELPQPAAAVRTSTLLQPFVGLGEDRLSGQPWQPLVAASPGRSSTAVGCLHPSLATVRFWGRKMMEHRISVVGLEAELMVDV